MTKIAQELKADLERAGEALGLAPSTVGERVGQGGLFYARLCDGKRVWPETAEAVRARLSELLSHDTKRGPAPAAPQPAPAEKDR